MAERDRAQLGLSPRRVEALADGVFSIAMTLLVLELKVPQVSDPERGPQLHRELFAMAPKIAGYAVTFIIIGTFWVGHHFQFHFIRRSDRTLLWINLLFLMFVAFLPFAAGLLGSYPLERLPALVYGGTINAAGVCLAAQWSYATRGRRLVEPGLPEHIVRAGGIRVRAGILVYGTGTALALLDTRLSLGAFALMPVLYLLPSGIDRHIRRGAK